VFGTRPQFIKLAVLWRELESRFRSVLIDSGQHYDWELAGAVRSDTGLRKPNIHLGVRSGTPASQIGRIADALDRRLANLKPHAVIVIGDTSTTAGGAIAAAYRGIPVAHVEAGLRSFNRAAPEEKNRILADHLSQWRFCPTTSSIAHLRREGLHIGNYGVGDLMYQHWLEQGSTSKSPARHADVPYGDYYYVTAHRAENVDSPEQLGSLVRILESLACPAIYPIHPRTQRNLKRLGFWKRLQHNPQIYLIPPVTYSASIALVRGAKMVLTDSGGLQREAYWSRVPCLVLRDVTEWPELVKVGAGALVGLNAVRASAALKRRWRQKPVEDRIFSRRNPAKAIAQRLGRDLASQ
jgi:UDP-N-acetylglucosamine 2-epimerase